MIDILIYNITKINIIIKLKNHYLILFNSI